MRKITQPIYIYFFFVDKSRNLFKFVLVLLSASVERVGVSRMRDFLINGLTLVQSGVRQYEHNCLDGRGWRRFGPCCYLALQNSGRSESKHLYTDSCTTIEIGQENQTTYSISLKLQGNEELCYPTMELNLEMETTLGKLVLTYVDTYLTC